MASKSTSRWDPNLGKYITEAEGRDVDRDVITADRAQNHAGQAAPTPKPVAQADEEDESKMSPMQAAAYRTKKKRQASMTGADAAAALASRK